MPRTLPAAIAAKVGQSNFFFLWLIEWQLSSGTLYLSSGKSVTYNGHAYEANRVMSISGLVAMYIDRKERDFSGITIKLDNLADNQSSSFPFTVLDASQVFEDALLKVHLYDVDASAAVDSLWFGYSGRPRFNPSDKTVELTARFLWDGAGITVPTLSLQQAGFSTIDTNRKKEFPPDETAIPLVYGVDDFKIRPTLYRASVEINSLFINGIVSGTAAGLPMDSADMTVGNCKLFDNTQATDIEFRPGGTDTVPDNLTRFPDGLAHNNIAYFSAIFPINNQTKDRLDRIKPDDVKIKLGNGRPLIDTGLPSENPVLILKDVLRDPLYGLGLANAAFDASAITAAAAAAAPNWQARLELHERMELGDFVQRMLADFHGWLTFNNGLIQIGVKGTGESSVATFATSDSGTSGRKIHEENVTAYEKEAGDIINEIRLKFRLKNRQERETVLYDATAQNRPGGNIKKVVTDRRGEATESLSLFEPSQVAINGAIILREELNGNLFIEFTTPLVEALSVAPGDIIIVKSPDIPNNTSNDDFRIISQTFDTEAFLCTFKCQVYKPAVYNYNTTGIGVDLLRGGEDTSSQGRPPDVTPGTLAVVDTETNDTGGKLATIRATLTYPVVDLATEQADGIFREYPIGAVRFYWQYTDENINDVRLGAEVRYPTTQADFQIDFYKNKSIRVFYVALGHNRSQSEIGYIADETKVGALTANLSATAATASVNPTTDFAVNDFALIENEIAKVASKTGSSITFVTSGGSRLAHFDTTAIAHPSGTQIAVAKLSYPSLVLALTAPRFTYPVVTGLTVRKRQDGVRVLYTDPSAENRENFLVYWSTDTDAGNNAAKLGVNNPTWYTTDPLTPPAGVNLRKNDDLDLKILQEDIGAAGTTVYVRVAARNGKHNFSATLSALASNSHFGDNAPAGAVQNILLKWSNRKGYKVTFDRPLTNFRSIIGYKILYYDGGSNFMNAITGQVASPNTIATAQFFHSAEQHATHLKKTDLAAAFLTGVVARVIPVNIVDGVETEGTAAFSGLVLPTEGDPMETDSAVPSGLDATPVLLYKKKGLVVKFAQATANMNTHSHNFIVIKKTGSSLYLTETSSGYATTATESAGRINVGKTGRPVFPISKADLQSLFGSIGTIEAYYYAVNSVGVSSASATSNTVNLATLEAEGLDADSAVPSGLDTPVLLFKKKGLIVKFAQATTNMVTHTHNLIVIKRTGSNLFLTESSSGYATTGTETAGRNNVGKTGRVVLQISREDVQSLLGSSGSIEAYYYAVNSVGTSLVSPTSNTVNLATLEADSVTADTTAPAISTAPVFKYKNGAWHCRLKEGSVSQIATLNKVELTINNGTNSINLDDIDVEVAASGIVFYDVGNQLDITIVMSKDQIRKIFGATGNARCAFRLTNDIGTAASSNSANKDLTTLREKSKRTNHQQLFKNPGFTQNDGGANLDRWIDFDPNANTLGTIQTGSGRLRWEDVNARVWWRENTATGKRYLAQNMGKTMLVNDQYSIRFFVESNGSLTINFDFFIATRFQATGTADPNGTTTLTGSGTLFLSELRAGDEITINSETRTVLSVSTNTSLTVTVAFSNTAGGAAIFVVSPQSEIIRMGNQSLTAGVEKQVEGTFTHFGFDQTKDKYVMLRPNGTISTAGPYLYFARPSFVLGPTPADFTLGWIDIDNFDTIPTGGGGFGQEPSGEVPGAGGFEIIQV